MHRLLDALKRIMQPPTKKKRPLIRRSAATPFKAKLSTSPPRPTEEETVYLTFFTNYCKRDDFQAYRSKFPDDFDLKFHRKCSDIQVELTSDLDTFSNREQNKKEQKEK